MSPTEKAPTGLPDDHILVAIDYIVDEPFLTDVYDPRWANLTADGTLVYQRRDFNAILGTTVTKLDAAGLQEVWSAIIRSGVFMDGNLVLPGFPQKGAPATFFVFQVDDGTRSTRLTIANLGSEQVFTGEFPYGPPPIPAAEMTLRTAASQLMDDLRAIRGEVSWTPPALLMWWRTEVPGDWDATILPWPLPIDLASAGHPIDHAVWDRCVRLDGDEATAVARFAQTLPIEHLVELDGVRYGIIIRAIHPDEIDQVACP
jgi:hypothetical protein